MACLSCASLAGARRVSPGPYVFEGRHWVLDHAYPVGLAGWLVLVLRRHAEALHDLTADEFAEMAAIQTTAVAVLRAELGCEKEYVAGWAEAPGFQHVHIHLIPKPPDLPSHLVGPGIFTLLGPAAEWPVPPETVVAVSERLRSAFLSRHSPDPAA